MHHPSYVTSLVLVKLVQGMNHSSGQHQFQKFEVVTARPTDMAKVTESASADATTLVSVVAAAQIKDDTANYGSDMMFTGVRDFGKLEKLGAGKSCGCMVPSTSVAFSSSTNLPSISVDVSSSSAIANNPSSPSSGISYDNMSPHSNKAGLSGYISIEKTPAFQALAPYISRYSDYSPNPPDVENIMGIGMLWGAEGSPCATTKGRLKTYNQVTSTSTPKIMFGFYEPDCSCEMSSEMAVGDAAKQWNSLIAPLADKGTILGSPSMCKQMDEDFLTRFENAISRTWDVTSIHINKPDLAGAKKDVEYYVRTYGKKIWVSEFACVNDQPDWSPCTDRAQITDFINNVVDYLESSDDVVAYGPSNGEGLGDAWPLTDPGSGGLTETGITYLNAIKRWHHYSQNH